MLIHFTSTWPDHSNFASYAYAECVQLRHSVPPVQLPAFYLNFRLIASKLIYVRVRVWICNVIFHALMHLSQSIIFKLVIYECH